MFPSSRAPVSSRQLRPLNVPRRVRVEARRASGEEERPVAVYTRRRLEVTAIRDQWRIDDEWWRREISRCYFQAVLEDGRCVTVFQDLLTRQWYCQSY